jgi:hypothetical protein
MVNECVMKDRREAGTRKEGKEERKRRKEQ